MWVVDVDALPAIPVWCGEPSQYKHQTGLIHVHQSSSLLSAAQAHRSLSYSNEYGINLELAERLCAFQNYFRKSTLLVLIPKPLGPDLSKCSLRMAQDSEDI